MKTSWSMVSSLAISVVVVMAFSNCDQSTDANKSSNDTIPSIRQGVYGYVEFWEGDFMPTVPSETCGGSITPVERTIEIHTPTRFDAGNQVDYSAFYWKLFTPCIAKTSSNAKGFFQVELPPGFYSIFVIENSLYYANGGDGQGYLCPVTVFKDSLSFVKLNITYKATF